ncbi:glycosyl hydrolase family 32 [Kaistia algarum]|uniref:glycoside hydrolase family 68 protein n=1 Tax=Kaistia algarum TaxID=2083279 RepID=UPI000CE7FF45|nr:glycoside hydrolase family 68 protein [Kaistia algarum]MCX5512805.1 glycoside hydrolase family 68 protein [Kaistia algarum]PPE81698.1 glycosyl hydrolase family 32 [Kaistia algarum]
MAFSLDDHWVWDFWLADDGALFHMYFLHAPRALGNPDLRHRNARIGHATSSNLTDWSFHGRVFEPGDTGAFDETATWTGSVVRGPDGLWRMFYTGTRFLAPDAHPNVETVGVATSPDLFHWTKAPGPICRADPRWYETLGSSSWPEEAWRDPWVFPSADGTTWHMLVTARANHGDELDRGVIGHATSRDLERWEVQPPLSDTGAGFAHLEVPQVVTLAGGTYLLFSCDSAKLAGHRSGGKGGIWSVAADAAEGPYPIAAASLIAPERLYSARVIEDRNGRPVLLAFHNIQDDGSFAGGVSDPLPLVERDGTLQIETNA